jgi:hypothetical protein
VREVRLALIQEGPAFRQGQPHIESGDFARP